MESFPSSGWVPTLQLVRHSRPRRQQIDVLPRAVSHQCLLPEGLLIGGFAPMEFVMRKLTKSGEERV